MNHGPMEGAAMSAAETLSAIGGGVLAALIAAWAALRGKQSDLLHASEVEFRKALLERIEQLEQRTARDGQRIRELEAMAREDGARIQELESEVRSLRLENDQLRRVKP